jgi:glutamate synthase (NADPH/NADH)
VSRARSNPWPQFARVKKWDYGISEVAAVHGKDPREYCISTKRFVKDEAGKLVGLDTVKVEWTMVGGQWKMEEVKGSEKVSLQRDDADC